MGDAPAEAPGPGRQVFALTGGIGSGKSAVAAVWREAGLPVVDADQVARQVVEPGSEALRLIREQFGESALGEDGRMDRAWMAQHVFGDQEALARLNGIVHPRVSAAAQAEFQRHHEAGADWVCYEIPLLFETGQEEKYRPVVVVSVPPEVQVARATARDGSTEDQVRARIESQLPLEEKSARADIVIDNTGSLEELRARSLQVLEQVRAG